MNQNVAPDGEADMVRTAIIEDLKVHVRIADQGMAPDRAGREALAASVPALKAFGSNRFARVKAVLDWDHTLPSQYSILRILACYSDSEYRRLETELRGLDGEIDETNLYPEFDLPDYGEVVASEVYAAFLRPSGNQIEDIRFLSPWRKQVTTEVSQAAVAAVKRSNGYKAAIKMRKVEGLGGAVVVGWAPPCLAEAPNWAIEIWLLVDFDGHSGKAHVFMVDSESFEVTREFETDVHLA